jgi:hypothetical protein
MNCFKNNSDESKMILLAYGRLEVIPDTCLQSIILRAFHPIYILYGIKGKYVNIQ